MLYNFSKKREPDRTATFTQLLRNPSQNQFEVVMNEKPKEEEARPDESVSTIILYFLQNYRLYHIF